jgi:hypothetical protein
VQIHQTQFKRLAAHQNIGQVEILLDYPAVVHLLHKAQDYLRIDSFSLAQFGAVETRGHQNAFLYSTPGNPFANPQVPHDGNPARFQLLRQLPFLPGLRRLKEKLQRTPRHGRVQVSFDIENVCAEPVPGDLLDGRFLDDFTGRLEEVIESRRELGLEFPAHAGSLTLNHARDFAKPA